MSLSAQEADLFESWGRLEATAYWLLGSAGDAEDAVQDAFLRWHAADRERIETPEAWLAADDHAARLTGRKVPETTLGYTVQRVTPTIGPCPLSSRGGPAPASRTSSARGRPGPCVDHPDSAAPVGGIATGGAQAER
jgi:hypothetical protein